MRKVMVAVCALMLCSLYAVAGETSSTPKAEFFGGYQFTHLEGTGSANGFNFAVNGNFSDTFGITGDFAAAYTTQGGVKYSNYTYTFGPVLSLRANKAYTPFVHALIGGDHGAVSVPGVSATGNGFALLAGGGVDANFAQHLAFRVAQVDWMMVHGSGGTSGKNYRISTGIVFRY